jgi:hypothetical protein
MPGILRCTGKYYNTLLRARAVLVEAMPTTLTSQLTVPLCFHAFEFGR